MRKLSIIQKLMKGRQNEGIWQKLEKQLQKALKNIYGMN